jgi:hypothetical protein
MNNDKNILIISFIVSLYISIIFIFPNSFYWVDDYLIINEIHKNSLNTIFYKFNSSYIVFTKLLFYFDIFFLDYSPQFYSYLAIFILLISITIFFKSLRYTNYEIDKKYYYIFILIFFSPKIFPSISQPINISWFIGLFLTLSYFYFRNRNKIIASLLIIINFANLSLGIVLCFFVILNYFFKIYYKIESKNEKIYFYLSIFLLIVFFIFRDGTSNLDIQKSLNNFPILIFNFFSLIGNFYLPWIKLFVFFGFFIGLLQISILKFYLKLNFKIILSNHFIFFGLLFCIITSIFRPDVYIPISPRYIFGVIFFQIGFFIELINKKKFIENRKFIIIFLTVFLVNFFTPYQGIHWQLTRSFKSSLILNCFNDKTLIDKKQCYEKSQKILFYNNFSFNKNDFEKILDSVLIKINEK